MGKCIKEVYKSKTADFSKCEKQYKDFEDAVNKNGEDASEKNDSFRCTMIKFFCELGKNYCWEFSHDPRCDEECVKCVKQAGCTPDR